MKEDFYTCNEGTFKVELLENEKCFTELAVAIRLLERIPFRIGNKIHFHEVGDVLHVGHWQVKRGKTE